MDTTYRDPAAANGAEMAAVLAAGLGSFAMGLFVILSELELFAAPSLYGPAGGVSGRTTFAVVAWLLAWGALHAAWRGKRMEGRAVYVATLALIVLGVALCFPPLWGLLA